MSEDKKKNTGEKEQVGYYRALLLHDANRVADEFGAKGFVTNIVPEQGKFHVYAFKK